jgi:hypothetical protein
MLLYFDLIVILKSTSLWSITPIIHTFITIQIREIQFYIMCYIFYSSFVQINHASFYQIKY